MEENSAAQIFVVTSVGERPERKQVERGPGESLAKGVINAISVSSLKANMEHFFNQLHEILDSGKDKIGAFQVEQVEVSAQITGDGKVCLMGSGVEVGVQGGIKFVLKRAKS